MDLNDAFIRAKERQAARKTPSSRGTDRLPPGQILTQAFPVLEISRFRPGINLARWRLEIGGAVPDPEVLDWQEFQGLPRVSQQSDFHCVTRWSKLDVPWGGVRWLDLLARAKPNKDAAHVIFTCADGYTTNLPLAELLREDVLLADTLAGRPLPEEHGGPLRLVVPHLYGWKSAKFLRKIEFVKEDAPGFWEVRGYHNHGDPWKEERYSN